MKEISHAIRPHILTQPCARSEQIAFGIALQPGAKPCVEWRREPELVTGPRLPSGGAGAQRRGEQRPDSLAVQPLPRAYARDLVATRHPLDQGQQLEVQ